MTKESFRRRRTLPAGVPKAGRVGEPSQVPSFISKSGPISASLRTLAGLPRMPTASNMIPDETAACRHQPYQSLRLATQKLGAMAIHRVTRVCLCFGLAGRAILGPARQRLAG